MEYWSNVDKRYLSKMKKLYNDMVRHATVSNKSCPISYQLIQLGWPSFDDLLLQKKANMFSRLIRSPITNILNQEIKDKFWENWKKDRLLSDLLNFKQKDYDEYFDNFKNNKEINDILKNVNENSIEFEGKIDKNNLDKNKWIVVQWGDEDFIINNIKKEIKKKIFNIHPFNKFYLAAKQLNNSDWIYMKNINMEVIPKRISYYCKNLIVPNNLKGYNLNINKKQIMFNLDWALDLVKNLNISQKELQLLFTDGSVKNYYGGAGYFSCNLYYYKNKLNIDSIRDNNYKADKIGVGNGYSNFCYGIKSVGIRTNIDHCELDAVIKGLTELWRYCYDMYKKLMNSKEVILPKSLVLIIDNLVVVKWLLGEYLPKEIIIYKKIKKIYDLIIDFEDWNMEVHVLWVKAHNNELGNECADDMAKLGMYDIYKTKNWKNIKKIYNNEEWENYTYNSVKNENKRSAFVRTIEKWENYKKDKKNLLNIYNDNRDNKKNEILTKNLVDWDIKYHWVYKFELKTLTRYQYKYIISFRTGHCDLNKQKKYGNEKKYCEFTLCINNYEEDINHFVFDCKKYNNLRRECFEYINQIYVENGINNFKYLENNKKLNYILFPFQLWLNQENIKKNDLLKNKLMMSRINILKSFTGFIKKTKRFNDFNNNLNYFSY